MEGFAGESGSESDKASSQIARLLQEGLDHYGQDEVDDAVRAWEAALEIDPDNAEARDYLECAGRLSGSNEGGSHDAQLGGLLENAHELLAASAFEEAFDLLSGGAQAVARPTLEIEGTIELVRSHLLRQYRRQVGDLDATPVMSAGSGPLTDYNLPTEAGFVLSLVDGATPFADLISLSGMDAFAALRLFRGLLDVGIVEVQG